MTGAGGTAPRGRWAAFRGVPLTVHAAALLFGALMVGFLVLYPTFWGFDEPQHVDRVYAATDGELWPDPGELHMAEGVALAEGAYVRTWPYQPEHSYVDRPELPRADRPSLIDLGAHGTEPPGGDSNQLSQHPPGYYLLVGAIMWLVPSDAAMPVDVYVFVLRALNVVVMAPLPYLVWWGTRKLTGEGPAAQAAAFVPALVPGLARVGATVNNDNLLIPVTTALLGFLAGVTKGDLSMRTARWVAGLLVVALLTKGTALVLPLVVAAAYGLGWARSRGRPPWRAVLTVAVAGGVGGLWWLRNLVLFDAIQPEGWGNRVDQAQGPLREPGDPASLGVFLGFARAYLPERFWGGLGLIEPPQLPGYIVLALTGLTLVMLLVCLVRARHNRAPIGVLLSGFVATMAITIYSSWSHFQVYPTIPGIQGRYGYPYLLGIAVVIGLGLTLLLGRRGRLAPLVVLAMALTVEYSAADAVVAHVWLPTGQLPRPGNVGLAFETLARFAPFPTTVTGSLIGLVGAAVLGSVVLAIVGVTTHRRPTAIADPSPRRLASSPP